MLSCRYQYLALAVIWAVAQNWAPARSSPALSAVAGPDSKTENRRAFAAGVYNLTYRSKVDGSLQPLLVQIPSGYSPREKWPLLITLHGRGDGPILADGIDAMIQIGPSGRGSVDFVGIGERDVFDCINMACTLFSIDVDRLYLCGFSMGAGATFDLGLRFPHLWAACVPVCGECEDLFRIPNARHLPFWIHAGGKDIMAPPKRIREVYEQARQLGFTHWQYTEHSDMTHAFEINWKDVQTWLLSHRRVHTPKQCTLVTSDMRSNTAYWTVVTALDDYGRLARIDAEITGQTVRLKTDNVSSYMLDLSGGQIDVGQEVRVLQNDHEVFRGLLDETRRLIKTSGRTEALCKRPGLSGPLWDIYSGTCLLIYGTSGEQALVQAARHCAESFADPEWMSGVAFGIVADKETSDAMVREHNIVLFGSDRSNAVLARLGDKLPIRMEGADIISGCRVYSGPDTGYVLIYPSPFNPEHYVAVFAGNTPRAANCFERIWPRLTSVPRDIDFGVFQLVSGNEDPRWLEKGIFDTYWQRSLKP
jgi:dienelactone hydrolase